MKLVKLTTIKQAPANSMFQLGKCDQRLIAILSDNYDPVQLFIFSKLDIKDGFWRLDVSDEDACNFFFILPQTIPVEILIIPG